MLRHIMSVSLAMTACATLIPTKANAATLTVTPVGTLQKQPGESITFIVALNQAPSTGNVLKFIFLDFNYDDSELSPSVNGINLEPPNTPVNNTKTIARLTFDVLRPVKDGMSDLFNVRAIYRDGESAVSQLTSIAPGVVDVVPVPEPLTIFGTATALGCGALFKRKSSKNKKS